MLRASSPMTLFALTLPLLLAGLGSAHAADAAKGHAIAQRWCGTCHVVDGAAAKAQSDAPTFEAIAKRDGDVSASWLAFRLLKPHPEMGQVDLTRTQAADLAAYFETLKK